MANIDPVEMAYLDWLVNTLIADQKAIQEARDYYNGAQADFLTTRTRQFLGLHEDNPFTLNVCETVVSAVANILNVTGFDTTETAKQNAAKPQAVWAAESWKRNKMASLQDVVHEFTLSDRETFVIVEWDEEEKTERYYHNQRFVDVDAGGDGMGVWMVYENDDIYQRPLYAVKQWVETSWENRYPRTTTRRTVYYPDHIERFVYDAGWHPFDSDDKPPVQAQTGKDGKPLGIPVIHFINKGYRAEHWKAIPMQDAINKTAVDILASDDLTAFKMFFAFGFIPTIDGKELKEDGSNAMTMGPGVMNGVANKKPGDASLQEIEGASSEHIMKNLIQFVTLTAQITDTPVSRFVITAQVAAEGTIKAQNDAREKKGEDRRGLFGDKWAQVLKMGRRISNLYANTGLDETVEFIPIWKHDRTLDELKQKGESLSIPQEQIWAEAGYSAQQIAEMKQMPSYRLTFEQKLWEGAQSATQNIPLEEYLRRCGVSEEEIKKIQDAISNQTAVPPTDL